MSPAEHTCGHRDHDEPVGAIAEYEGIVQPDNSIRFKACEEHAPDYPPLRFFDAGDGNSRLVSGFLRNPFRQEGPQ